MTEMVFSAAIVAAGGRLLSAYPAHMLCRLARRAARFINFAVSNLAVSAGIVVTLCFSSLASAQSPEIARGLAWLALQVQPNGSLSSESASVATNHQVRSEAYIALKQLSAPPAAIVNAVSQDTDGNTEYLSRIVLIQRAAGSDSSATLARLLAVQNVDGGFGAYSGYSSQPLDTAFALLALQGTNVSAIGPALGYLQTVQALDGSFEVGQQSSQYATAVALLALDAHASQYNLATTRERGVSYLLGNRHPNGSWENSVFLTSLAFLAVRNSQPPEPLSGSMRSYLVSTQTVDGSWDADPYTSALALRALALTFAAPSNPALASIRGGVVDAQTGQALGGVAVALSGPSTQSLVAAANGEFEFRDLQPGSYSLQITFANYTPISTSTSALAGGTVNLGALLMSKIAGATTGTISGVVRDAATGLPISGALVSADNVSTPSATDASGAYQITNVPAGSVLVQASKAGYLTASGGGSVPAGGILDFSPVLSTGQSGTPSVTGSVVNAVSGAPLSGVLIQVTSATSGSVVGGATTDSSGGYLIANVAPGALILRATLASFDTVTATATLTHAGTVGFSPRMYPVGTSPPNANRATVRGIVVDAGTDSPLANVQVVGTFNRTNQTALTGADGSFVFEGITSESVELAFSFLNYEAAATAASVTPLAAIDLGQVRMRKVSTTDLRSDLIVRSVSRAASPTDTQSLLLSGTLNAVIENIGATPADSNILLLAFFDANRDSVYTPGTDLILGKAELNGPLNVATSASVAIPVQGKLPFRDAPLSVWVDSAQAIVELKENNNIGSTATACEVRPPVGNFNPVLKWSWTGSAVVPTHNQVITTPIVVPLHDSNGDGKADQYDTPAVVFSSYRGTGFAADGVLRAVSGKDGSAIWTVSDPALRVNPIGQIAAADIDGSGSLTILVPLAAGGIAAFTSSGSLKWTSSVPSNTGRTSGWNWGGPAIADLNHDGKAEIIMGNTVLNHDGTLRWQGSGFTGDNPANGQSGFNLVGPLSVVADINLDGSPVVIAGASAYSSTGQRLWQNTSVGDGFAAVGKFREGPYPQIVVVSSGRLFMLDRFGVKLWGPVALPFGGAGGAPTIADMDGDGVPEIGVAGAARYTAFRADGTILWSKMVQDGSSFTTGSSVFDFEGDGKAEVVYSDERNLRIFSGKDGAVLFQKENTSGTGYELPVIADVDNDNHADLVVCSNQLLQQGFLGWYPGPGVNGIRVYQDASNSWVNTRKIWNQHSYHITNVNEDGSVPRVESSSWDVHNTYRLNAQPGLSATAVPDLTASYTRVQDRGGVTPSSFTVRVGNSGGLSVKPGASVAFYSGQPGAGGVLLGTVKTVGLLATGMFEDVTLSHPGSLSSIQNLVVVVDDNGAGQGAILECDESNNVAALQLSALPGSLSIQVSTNSPSYGANENVVIDGLVSNAGSFPASGVVRFAIESGDGQVQVATVAQPAAMTILPLSQATVPAIWNTSAFLVGNYRVRADLIGNDGKPFAAAFAPFAIVAAQGPAVGARISSDKATYPPRDTVLIRDRIQNRLQNQVLEDLTASTLLLAPDGGVFWSASAPLPQLLSGALRDLAYQIPLTSEAMPGQYTATLTVKDASGSDLATSQTSFLVQSSADTGAGLRGSLVADPWRANLGDAIGLDVRLSNSGNSAVDLPALIRIIDPIAGIQVAEFSLRAQLAVSGEQTFTTSWTPVNIPAGHYVAALIVNAGGRELLLAQDTLLIGAIIPFMFSAQTGVALSALATSNAVSIDGIVAPESIAIVGGEYSINGGPFTNAAGTVIQGDRVTVRQTASANFNTKSTAMVTVGTFTAGFDVTTLDGDTTPDPFTFQPQIDVPLGSVRTSNTVTLSGLNVPVPISIIGGTYSINGGLFVTTSGTVKNGDTLTLRQTASANPTTTTSAIVTVSGYSTSFNVTTEAAVAPVVTFGLARDARILVLLSCKNSSGNADDPTCVAQRKEMLENYLAASGFDAKIVTDRESFRRELRCGRYNTFWIAGGFEKLGNALIGELRETVFAGAGLLLDGLHDQRNSQLDEIAGVRYRGKPPQPATVLINGSVFPAGSFGYSGDPLRLDTTTGQVQARFGSASGDPAIVSNTFGRGRSLHFAFDAVATLQAQGGAAFIGDVLDAGIAQVSQAPQSPLAGDAYMPVQVDVTNGATVAQTFDVTVTWPAAFSWIEGNPPPTSTTATTATWRVTMPAGQRTSLSFALRAPTVSGSHVIGLQVSRIDAATGAAQGVHTASLPVLVAALDNAASQTVAAIQALSLSGNQERRSRDDAVADLQQALTKSASGLIDDAVAKFVSAAENLAEITSVSVEQLRVSVARQMAEAGRKSCAASAACAVSSLAPSAYGLMVFGSASLANGESHGSVGVGGAASVSSFTVASQLRGDAARLVAGGSVTYTNGSVGQGGSGVIIAGGSASISQSVGRADVKANTANEDWTALKAEALALADSLAARTGTAATIVSGNQFNCTGTNASWNVCVLSGSQLGNARTINLNYPASAGVLVNVTGGAATLTNGQANFNGQPLLGSSAASRVIFNFAQAGSVSISGFGIGGTVLAPRASLSHANNAIDGQVIVNSLSSTGSYRCGGVFQGSVPAQ